MKKLKMKMTFPVKHLKTIIINPVGKPRMVNSDRWLVNKPDSKLTKDKIQRKRLLKKYWDYKDELNLKLKGFVLPDSNYWIVFYIPMPKSWSKKKKKLMVNRPHQQVPDRDNFEKAFLDCIFKNDSHIWDGRVTKLWSDKGQIDIFEIQGDFFLDNKIVK